MTPNPGSSRARSLGCRCPIGPNNDGVTPPFEDGYYEAPDCTLHGVPVLPCEDGLR